MGVVVDSSVLIAAERGVLDVELVLRGNSDESVAIAAVTASELLHIVASLRHLELYATLHR